MPISGQRWSAFVHILQTDTGMITLAPAKADRQYFIQTLNIFQSVSGAVADTIESSDGSLVFAHVPPSAGVGVKVQINLPAESPGFPVPKDLGLRVNIGAAGNRLQIAAGGYIE